MQATIDDFVDSKATIAINSDPSAEASTLLQTLDSQIRNDVVGHLPTHDHKKKELLDEALGCSRRLYNFVNNFRPSSDPQDIVAETILRFYVALNKDKYRGESKVFTYLCSIAKRIVLDEKRRNKLHNPYSIVDEDMLVSKVETADKDLERRELRYILAQALTTLPDRARTVAELRLSGFKSDEIAVGLGITEGTVKNLYHRAFVGIKEYVETHYRQLSDLFYRAA